MNILINEIEVRVLGCLLEKSMTTPEYYPLSLSALTNACNQKSSRDPVVTYDQETVEDAIDTLKEKQLVVRSDSSRVVKYAEVLVATKNLIPREAAILMLLLLRGPQTVGELRARSDRAYSFENLQDVESTIDDLIEMGYVKKLPRLPGRKEPRCMHLLSGEPDTWQENAPMEAQTSFRPESTSTRVTALEEELAELKNEIETLKTEFTNFRKQFE